MKTDVKDKKFQIWIKNEGIKNKKQRIEKTKMIIKKIWK